MPEKKLNAKQDLELIERLAKARADMGAQLKKVIVGQESVIDDVLTALFSRGHVLIVGVPGLAKTLLIESIAKILVLDYKRIQFTPDLMPSDITGTEVIEESDSGKRVFRFIEGPVFANIILADEINRTPPKTQSALLQAMQEYKITAAGKTYSLPLPFFVLATQNPIEHEGTYPLPEAQLDRFFFNIKIDYPSKAEEAEIVRKTTGGLVPDLIPVLNAAEIIALQDLVRRVPASGHLVDFAVNLVSATRPGDSSAPSLIKELVEWGAGPRASQALVVGAKARAALHGRLAASVEDVAAVAHIVLRHRIVMSFKAEAGGVSADRAIDELLVAVKPG